ncbi:hypothetical protein FB446DRAFT_736338 [Lentinula raphanica]|nr:hypothetical protein FB446DRAFT_736338 [Lentinula raphanica]
MNNADEANDAPGAYGDESRHGLTAISMKLARIMATHETKAAMMFICAAGEGQGLFGSNSMAEQLKVQGMLDNDIVDASNLEFTGPAHCRRYKFDHGSVQY